MAHNNRRGWNSGGHFHRRKDDNDPFDNLAVRVPKGTLAALQKLSGERKIPLSRLVMIALDNEFESPAPFNYPVQVPDHSMLDGAFQTEAQAISAYLLNFPSGLGRDLLMLARRDFGVPDRGVFLHAYRQLLVAGIVEEGPPSERSKFSYSPGYVWVKLAGMKRSELIKRRMEMRLRKEAEYEPE